jgi:hypothetical protein
MNGIATVRSARCRVRSCPAATLRVVPSASQLRTPHLALRTGAIRSGTILIIVAGISALLASLTLTFLVQMRSDLEESQLVVKEARSRLMLIAACNYVMESSRLGWSAAPGDPTEGFGWIDVRDGTVGPKNQSGTLVGGGMARWIDLALAPGQRPAVRCPMFVERRPPFAVMPTVAPNPIPHEGPDLGKALCLKPDPIPVVDAQAQWDLWVAGDRTPDPKAPCETWFRVYRDGAATFTVTCGAGGTQGFRSWDEVVTAGAAAEFNDDRTFFASLRNDEVVRWYRIAWSAAVAASDYQHLQNEGHLDNRADHYTQRSMNVSRESRSQGRQVNAVGTIAWVQRLLNEPDHW